MKVLGSNIQTLNNIGDQMWDIAAKINSAHGSPHNPLKRPILKDQVKEQSPIRSLDRLQCKIQDLELRLLEPWLAV